MKWIRPLDADIAESADLVGAKARGLVELHRLGLPVPAGFVVTTEACRAFLRDGHLPAGLGDELESAMALLEKATGRRFGGRPPLAVSVRSGASVSMPGMMDTILNLGLTAENTAALAAETDEAHFALESRLRFEHALRELHGCAIPNTPAEQLKLAVETVFASWRSPRARTYRELHAIDHDLGTAVIVQVMVFGNRNERSGTGVAFSRNPSTGEPTAFGEVLFAHQGEDVVAGTSATLPLDDLATRQPEVWKVLADALERAETHYRDAVYVEFTFEAGKLWLLQVRPGRFTGAAAVRVAVDLAGAGRIAREEAVLRVSPRNLDHARTPRIDPSADTVVLGRAIGACPGVATGRLATTTEAAIRMSSDGAVILVRPETSPNDMNGLAVAAGILTARGGPASHAAVVARAMNKPAVVGLGTLTVEDTNAAVTINGRALDEGTLITIDGSSGEVVLGRAPLLIGGADEYTEQLLGWADDLSGDHGTGRGAAERLDAARSALQRNLPR
ncbi:pyruvate, phosphate dikinase [Amycolatopsis taiwanensis]|uniref:Pyruvate, phosphate dikinase n=1 Tax=Amycolatopsis taiwanensis TaxID=342230 RepID=A0A9W6QZN7_9PSEU|nr:pyruvate, phosphate dikinase [Amycolatopsis taiwanensis]GLY64885.1 hypothetical protein Atai01_15040 [Amycolatopsis taiwanensis]